MPKKLCVSQDFHQRMEARGPDATHLAGNARGLLCEAQGASFRAGPRLRMCVWAGETFLCL